MSYRPQFAYPASPGRCAYPKSLFPNVDQKCQYSFDSTNTPQLAASLAAGARTGLIPLILDMEADFYLRAIRASAFDLNFGGADLSFRLVAPGLGDPLSDSENAVDAANYVKTSQYSDTVGAGVVALESGAGGVFCPGGGNFSLYLFNDTAGTVELTTFSISLIGVKVYPKVCV